MAVLRLQCFDMFNSLNSRVIVLNLLEDVFLVDVEDLRTVLKRSGLEFLPQ